MSNKLYILGHSGYYGGASSELLCQIKLWSKAFPEIELHTIPTQQGYKMESTYHEMLDLGMIYHDPMDFSSIKPEDAIINFCSSQFLENLEEINRFTKRTMWVNCMTYLFPTEKKKAHLNFRHTIEIPLLKV